MLRKFKWEFFLPILIVLIFTVGASGGTITVNTVGRPATVDTGTIEVLQGAGNNTTFVCEDAQYLSKSGEPQIPWKLMTVLLPPNADMATVLCSVISAEYETLEGVWDVAPVPPILSRDADGNEIVIWPAGKTIVDGRDTDIYSADALWPAEDVQLIGKGRLRGWRLAEIAVPLVCYNPVSGELQRLVQAEISVDCDKKGKGSANKGRKLGRIKKLAVNFDSAVDLYTAAKGGIKGEPEDAPASDDGVMPASVTGTSGYVIITTNDIRANSTKLADFVTHKQSMGFTVTVIDEDDTGATVVGDPAATKLREWLQANYIAMDLKYALIIGDPQPANGYVPMKMYPCGGRDIPTDYFYAELTCDWDSNDNGIIGESGEIERYFEVYVGRIPHYGVMADTDAILQKTIDYETAVDTDWRRNTLISVVPLDTNMHCYNWGEQVKADLLEPDAVSSDRAYRDGYGHTVTNYDILPPPEFPASAYPATVWSQGQYGLHIWSTHGWSQGASGIVASTDTPNLDDNYPSTTFQGSCETAYPYHDNNLTYMILKNGGIVANGATRNSYYMAESEFSNSPTDAGMGYRYAKGIVEGKSCGEALWDMKEEISSWWTHNWTLFNPYGDPSVVVMPERPVFTVTPTDRFFTEGYIYEPFQASSRTYTLINDGVSSLNWTASKTANWVDLSATSGTIAAGGTAILEVSLNTQTAGFSLGTYLDTVTITDTTHAITVERGIEYVISKRVPRTDYEAEDAVWSGPAFANNNEGYSGTGYLDYQNASGDYIEWTINAASDDGLYTLAFRYALATGDRPLEVKVDGQVVEASLNFPSTGSWSNWDYAADVVVSLTAGSHTVRTTAIGSGGGNVDLLRVYDGLNFEDIDAYVRGGTNGDTNYGSATTLDVKNQGVNNDWTRESYLRFNYNYGDTDPIQSANLILTPYSLQDGGETSVITVRLLDDADDGWVENEITYNNRPQGTGLEVTFLKGDLQLGVPYSIDVTALLEQAMNANKVVSFQIVSNAAYHVVFHSQEAGTDVPILDIVTSGGEDTTPPSPDPMTFAAAPAATGTTSISMTATMATDASGVEYYFTCTAGGGNDSGWQDSTTYEDTGLTPDTQYTYTVNARDKSANQNMTAASAGASATTDATADTDPPTPNPATFAAAPAADSDTAISMTATTGSDASGPVEYLFTETSGNPGGTSSAWQTSTSYTDTALTASTQYTYTVTMRDSLANTGTASSPASATTDDAPAVPAAPSSLSATAIAATRIDLSWTDNASDETGFKIERSKRNNGSFAQIATVGQDAPSYSDTTVRKGTTYYYRVRATNANGDSAYSNEANATTPRR